MNSYSFQITPYGKTQKTDIGALLGVSFSQNASWKEDHQVGNFAPTFERNTNDLPVNVLVSCSPTISGLESLGLFSTGGMAFGIWQNTPYTAILLKKYVYSQNAEETVLQTGILEEFNISLPNGKNMLVDYSFSFLNSTSGELSGNYNQTGSLFTSSFISSGMFLSGQGYITEDILGISINATMEYVPVHLLGERFPSERRLIGCDVTVNVSAFSELKNNIFQKIIEKVYAKDVEAGPIRIGVQSNCSSENFFIEMHNLTLQSLNTRVGAGYVESNAVFRAYESIVKNQSFLQSFIKLTKV